MPKTPLSESLFWYLILWSVSTMILTANFSGYLIYSYQIFTVFLLGMTGIVFYHSTRRKSELVRWSIILMASGLLLLILDFGSRYVGQYLLSLTTSPYLTIGLTALILGMIGILVRSIPVFFRLIDALMARIGSRRTEEQ